MIEQREIDASWDALSEQCHSENIDYHGFCSGIAEDGDYCLCAYCRHPRSHA